MATVIPQVSIADLVFKKSTPDAFQALNTGLQFGREAEQRQALLGQQKLAGQVSQDLLSGNQSPQALAQLMGQNPEMAGKILKQAGIFNQQGRDELARTAFELESIPAGPQRNARIQEVAEQLKARGGNPNIALGLLNLDGAAQDRQLQNMQLTAMSAADRQGIAEGTRSFDLQERQFGLNQQKFGLAQTLAASTIAERAKPTPATSAQREFADLTAGLTPEQKKEARLIELGLSPRAVGNAIQTITKQGIATEIGKSKATIKEREKFGELNAASRSKAIDKGFETIRKIDGNVLNLDRAIAAVEAGAGTGAIERLFPSIMASSVMLDQIQGELALDVVGAVTFGALSEGELNLAKQIALPTGLDGPELIKHLQDKKTAQEKLRGYFNEQIQFLDQGGSVAKFLRSKERKSKAAITLANVSVDDLFNMSDEELEALRNQ